MNRLATLNLNCQRAARLLSDATERPLTRLERFGLRAHLLGCRSCRRYRRHLEQIAAALRSTGPAAVDDGQLPSAARARIAATLAPPSVDDGPRPG